MSSFPQEKAGEPSEMKVFDIVITHAEAESPRFMSGLGKELVVASGVQRLLLGRIAPPRTRVLYDSKRDLVGITAKKLTETQILDELRRSGLRYSAFGEDNPYPQREASLIDRWERSVRNEWDYMFQSVSQVKREGRFLWLRIPPVECAHRQCDSHGVMAFASDESAISFVDYLELKRSHCIKSSEILGYVFDPDLGLGDYGIDQKNAEALPADIAGKALKHREGDYITDPDEIIPARFRPGMLIAPPPVDGGGGR